MSPITANRSAFSTHDTITYLWRSLNLPENALGSIALPGTGPGLPSSLKVGHLAQATIALSALAASLIHGERTLPTSPNIPHVTVPLTHACIELKSERFYTINNQPPACSSYPIGGLHRTADGHVRIHDGFSHHRAAALRLIGCAPDATREQIAAKLATLSATDLEARAPQAGAIAAALRSPAEWDATPQARAVPGFPVVVRRIGRSGGRDMKGEGVQRYWPAPSSTTTTTDHLATTAKALAGLRVVELSRVLAAPVAGRTLAAHGADVLWVTSPRLPDLPGLDRDTARGKRTVQIDLETGRDRERLRGLVSGADVFVQGYRPGSLKGRGFGEEDLVELVGGREGRGGGIVCASLSAYGSEGPWSGRRGFDSIVQTQSGINFAEAEAYAEWEGEGKSHASRVLPCQALDHTSGYLLAFGIMVALHRRAREGGSYAVEVSLAGTMKYLRSLGRLEGREGFDCTDYERQEDVPEEYLETRDSGFGQLKAVKHSASIEGVEVGWDVMPKPLGSDEAVWL